MKQKNNLSSTFFFSPQRGRRDTMQSNDDTLRDEEARVLQFYGSSSVDDFSSGPALSARLLALPSVQELLLKGLLHSDAAVQGHVLRAIRRAVQEPRQVPDALWNAAVELVASPELDVAHTAMQVVLQFGHVERVQGALGLFKRIEANMEEVHRIRLLELMVQFAIVREEYLRLPVVRERVDVIVRSMENDGDLLAQLAILELVSSLLVSKPWTLQLVLQSGVVERAAKAVKAGTVDPHTSPSWIRFAGAVARQGDEGFGVVSSAGWLDVVTDSIDRAGEVPESRLDSALTLLENIAIGSEAGCMAIVPLLDGVLTLMRGGDTYGRVRACHSMADLLEFARGEALLPAILASKHAEGLGAKLLSLAQQPLLSEQRVSVFRVLTLFIAKALRWTHQSTPSLFHYCINRNLDTEKDAQQWRFAMAQAYLAGGNVVALEVLGQERYDLLTRFLRGGVYGRSWEAKPDVAKLTE